MGKRGAGTGFLGRGKLGRDIMALCIMSKCGGNVVVSERKGRGCGEGHYGIMHNVEVWGKWVGKG